MSCAIEGQKYFVAMRSYVFVSPVCPVSEEPRWFVIIMSLMASGTHNLLDDICLFLAVKTYKRPLGWSIVALCPYKSMIFCTSGVRDNLLSSMKALISLHVVSLFCSHFHCCSDIVGVVSASRAEVTPASLVSCVACRAASTMACLESESAGMVSPLMCSISMSNLFISILSASIVLLSLLPFFTMGR